MGLHPRCYIPISIAIGPLVFEKKIFDGCLAWLFSKKTLRYCHSPVIVVVVIRLRSCHGAKTLTFSNTSVITEDIYLKLKLVVNYQRGAHTSGGGNPQFFFDIDMPPFLSRNL